MAIDAAYRSGGGGTVDVERDPGAEGWDRKVQADGAGPSRTATPPVPTGIGARSKAKGRHPARRPRARAWGAVDGLSVHRLPREAVTRPPETGGSSRTATSATGPPPANGRDGAEPRRSARHRSDGAMGGRQRCRPFPRDMVCGAPLARRSIAIPFGSDRPPTARLMAAAALVYSATKGKSRSHTQQGRLHGRRRVESAIGLCLCG